jgi:ABC-2 type transport system permease protein
VIGPARRLFLVAERELSVRLRSRAWRIASLAAPLVLAAITWLPAMLLRLEDADARRIAILDRTDGIGPGVSRRLEQTGRYVVELAGRGTDEEGLRSRLAAGEIEGYLVIPADAQAGGEPAFYARTSGDPAGIELLQRAVSDEITRRRASAEGLDPARVARLNRPVAVQSHRVGAGRGDAPRADPTGLAEGFLFALYFMILLYGLSILTSVTEEKANRTVEVLFSSVRPFELVGGKLLGVGGAALLQYALWVVTGFLLLRLLPSSEVLAGLQNVSPALWAAFAFFFCAGFFLFGSLYLTLGALSSSTEEAQQTQLPVTGLALLSFLLGFYAMSRPESPLAAALSLLPPFTPMLLFARMVVSDVPAWQVALGVILLLGGVVGGVFAAARVFRTAMLLTGRRARLREVVSWLRRG